VARDRCRKKETKSTHEPGACGNTAISEKPEKRIQGKPKIPGRKVTPEEVQRIGRHRRMLNNHSISLKPVIGLVTLK
jgi:hypothetical protein